MSAHDHREFVRGCFRCDLSREEAKEYEESTPTTEEVEEMFVDLPPGQIEGSVESRRFRRWHAAELAAAEKRGAAQALREYADAMAAVPDYAPSHYDQGRVDQRHMMIVEMLTYADKLAGEHDEGD